nr:hypothetical protein [Tanacetum cinerariifolium]
MATPRLSAAAKGKQPARAISPTDPLDVERTDAEQLKRFYSEGPGMRRIFLSKLVPVQMKELATKSGEGADEEAESDRESGEEETMEQEEESFDPIPRTLEDGEDDGNGKEDQGLRIRY